MVKLDPDEEKALAEAVEIVDKAHAEVEREIEKEDLRNRLRRVSELLSVVQV